MTNLIRFNKCYVNVAFVVFLLVYGGGMAEEIHEIGDNQMPYCWWEVRQWNDADLPEACLYPHQPTPDSGFYNLTHVGRDRLANYGYPYHYSLISGINDTLDALITFENTTGPYSFVWPDYDLKDKKIEQWFAPQVYMDFAKGRSSSVLLIESTQLGYRLRGWSDGWRPLPPFDILRKDDYERVYIKLDIWNLPQGRFQVCILPTDKISKDLQPHVNGCMVEFYPARNLADSCNGYEGCYWRATYDSNFTAAKEWASQILHINPKSVPGWWLMADNALNRQDTSEAKAAYDNAIEYLNRGEDPAMPDSTKRPLMQIEKQYIECLQAVLPYLRARLGL